jgi:V8-like Glu-specific endopeptidase
MKTNGEASSPLTPPLTMEQLARKRPILHPTERQAAPITRTSIYVEAASTDVRPHIRSERIATDEKRAIWKMTLEGLSKPDIAAAPYPRRRLLSREDLLRSQSLHHAPGHGFRPPEAEVFYHPRTTRSESPRRIRRFDGSRITAANITQIFSADDRQLLLDTSYPWSCIGKIWWQRDDGATKWGSAALVGPSTIVTASHLLPWNEQATLWFSAETPFLPGSHQAFVLDQTSYSFIEDEEIVAGYDIAVCHLSEPLGNELGYFGYKKYVDDWEGRNYWTTVGYPWDILFSLFPIVEHGIAIEDDDSDDFSSMELETKADTASGMSGGPLFAFWEDGGPCIIGVMSGVAVEGNLNPFQDFSEKNSVFAGGNALLALCNWARSEWGG